MPKYVLLSRANESGSGNILTWGTKGRKDYKDLVKAVRGKLISQYVVTGHYDLISVVDFVDDAACLAFSLRSQAGGLYVDALRAYEDAEVDEATKRVPDVVELRRAMLGTDQTRKKRSKPKTRDQSQS